jgi:2-keto-4-pentenoate hydratase/2-oxohepta-3-ene-1,7-dioic acid hydratase in catechol pathway
MRIARVEAPTGTYLARIDGENAIPVAAAEDRPFADPLRDALATGVDPATAPAVSDPVPLDSYRLLAPLVAPQKVLAIGLNYADHAREAGVEPPAAPVAFVKTNNSIIGPDEAIRYHKEATSQVDYEAELAAVIGRRARNVAEDDALDHVFGYTACNDVSARDAQFPDRQWVRGKSFDTFCPIGPWVVTGDEVGDPQTLGIACRVNGATLQDSSTAEMVFGVAQLVSYLSRFMTLEPGDIIVTGTPAGVGFVRNPPVWLDHDDVVEVEIERIGVLRNPVIVSA